MSYVSSMSPASGDHIGVTRPMVKGLFIASCLLSIVSWYTTEQGMALYLSGWFALIASLGVQVSLVLVAWLIGFTKTRRALLIAVYVITAVVSIAFSYVSLYTWFSARERPVAIERRLYDTLSDTTGKTEAILNAAIAEQQKHVLALREMTGAEKEHGYISKAQDADPYLATVREAVAREAQTYSAAYREGSGDGLRYTAFDRYEKLAEQSLGRLETSAQALTAFQTGLKPGEASEQQLSAFRRVYDAVPWSDAAQSLDGVAFEKPVAPRYEDFVDKTSGGQEDLLVAFQELITAPTGRHIFAFTLAAFIDVIVFLLAFASGPFFFGGPEQRWVAAGASLDALDDQIFVRSFLGKLAPSSRGMARVAADALTPGEQQLCLLLAAKGLAVMAEEDGRRVYLLDQSIHEQLFETLASRGFPLRASAHSA